MLQRNGFEKWFVVAESNRNKRAEQDFFPALSFSEGEFLIFAADWGISSAG
jgi:hypothetical protein